MAGKESAVYAPQKTKDTPGMDEKLLGLGKWSNKYTIPLGGVFVAGGLVFGAPLFAAGALAGMGTDYMFGEYTEEWRQNRKRKRLQRTVEKSGKMTSFRNPERAKAIDAKLQANQGPVFIRKG